jgi:hypothetical protein
MLIQDYERWFAMKSVLSYLCVTIKNVIKFIWIVKMEDLDIAIVIRPMVTRKKIHQRFVWKLRSASITWSSVE